MGSFTSVRKASGALKDSTKVGLAKVNSDYKDLDIATVKATNHVDIPPKERHVIRVRRLIVVEAGSKRIEGIITLSDIFRFLLS